MRVSPADKQKIPLNPDILSNVTVSPYGKWKGLTQVKAPENLIPTIIEKLKENPNKDILVKVKLSSDASRYESWGPYAERIVSFGKQLVSPFTFEYAPTSAEAEPKGKGVVKYEKLADAFPAITAALTPSGVSGMISGITGGRIGAAEPTLEARYYLNLPAGANRDSINDIYRMRKAEWEDKKKDNVVKPEYADEVLRILEIARNALVAEIDLKELSAKIRAQK